MDVNGRIRVSIENVDPEINEGKYPVKKTEGESVSVEADIFADGHDLLTAVLLYRHSQSKNWIEIPMCLLDNDRWRGEFTVEETGLYLYTLKAWVNHFQTWRQDLQEKLKAGHDVRVDLKIGAELIQEASKRAQEPDQNVLKQWAQTLKQTKSLPPLTKIRLD